MSNVDELNEKLDTAIASKEDLKDAVNERGVDTGNIFSTYGDNIREIITDVYTWEEDNAYYKGVWEPCPEWINIRKIAKREVSQYCYTTVVLMTDYHDTFQIPSINNFNAYNLLSIETSDSSIYTVENASSADTLHVWDKSKDKKCIRNGYSTRYVLLRHKLDTTVSSIKPIKDDTVLWVFTDCPFVETTSTLGTFKYMESYEGVDKYLTFSGAAAGGRVYYLFMGCTSLRYVSPMKGFTFNSAVFSAFNNCTKLQYIPEFEVIYGAVGATRPFFWLENDVNLQFHSNEFIDCEEVTDFNNILNGVMILSKLKLKNVGNDLNVSALMLSAESVKYIVNNLKTVHGKTLKLSATNKSQLTPDEISNAVAKGWTIQ